MYVVADICIHRPFFKPIALSVNEVDQHLGPHDNSKSGT